MKQQLTFYLVFACCLPLFAQKPDLRFPLDKPNGYVDLSFSRDGKYIFTASANDVSSGDLRLWETASGKLLRAAPFPSMPKWVLAAPDGRSAAFSAGFDFPMVHCWDSQSGKFFPANEDGPLKYSASGRLGYFLLHDLKLAAIDFQAGTSRDLFETENPFAFYPSPLQDAQVLRIENTPDGKSKLFWENVETGKSTPLPNAPGFVKDLCWVNNQSEALVQLQNDGAITLQLFNLKTGKWGKSPGQINSDACYVTCSLSGDRVFILTSDNRQYLLDFKKQATLEPVKDPVALINADDGAVRPLVQFTPTGELLAVVRKGAEKIEVWDILTRKKYWELDFELSNGDLFSGGGKIAFSPDGRYLLFGAQDGVLQLRHSKSGSLVREFTSKQLRQVQAVNFAEKTRIQLLGPQASAWQLDLESARVSPFDPASFSPKKTGTALTEFGSRSRYESFLHSRDGSWEARWFPYHADFHDNGAGTTLARRQGSTAHAVEKTTDNSWTTTAAFSPDNTLALIGRTDNSIQVVRTADGKLQHSLKGHSSSIEDIDISPDNRYALSVGEDKTEVKLWDLQQGRELASLYFYGQQHWAVLSPTGLFDASSGMMEQMYYVYNQEVIELEQLKERYYEPGLLQKLLGYVPGGLRDVSTLDKLDFYPEITAATIREDKLKVQLNPRNGGIGRVVLLLNDNIELEPDANPGRKAAFELDLSRYARFFVADTISQLSLRAYNGAGWLKGPHYRFDYHTETTGNKGTNNNPGSLRDSRDADFKAIKLYALIVGTSNYSGESLKLKYPDKDAAAFAEALRTTGARLFGNNIEIKLLNTGAEPWPRRAEIRRQLKGIAEKATPNDILLVYLSGHGITYPPNSEKGQFHYLSTDISSDDLSDPAVRNTKAIAQDSLQSWLNEITARKRILILDACNSGKAVDKLTAGDKDLGTDQRRALERMQDRSGMFVLAGSAADKPSFEASRFGHGLLTYSLLNNMPRVAAENNSFIDVGKLFNNTLDEVNRLAGEIGKSQQPEMIGNGSFDIGIIDGPPPYPIPQKIPVFIRANFTDRRAKDVARLSGAINHYLETLASKKEPNLAFWDIAEFEGDHYYLGGQYEVNGDLIQGTAFVYRKDAEVASFPFSGTSSEPEKLAERIYESAIEQLD
ncbi:MAG: caspase family protein [Lewinellaceae bacterium]|nr:caspase family protein [Lewinellaceae bacterium]